LPAFHGVVPPGVARTRYYPTPYRIGSVFSALFFVLSILVTLSRGDIISLFDSGLTTVLFWIYTIYFGIGIFMNAFSRSKIERLWAPIVTVMFFRAFFC
jgi:hypothetical protein